MILLIDNYDSFSYNLFQLVGMLYPDIKVIRNDELSVDQIEALRPDGIILSPGPGKPCDAGIIEKVVKKLGHQIPILGVCLGHQAICEVFGADIIHAPKLMHGKKSTIAYNKDHFLFKNCTSPLEVGRYHSLAASLDPEDETLEVLATSEDGQIMAVAHKTWPVYGLQFHPESILSPQGPTILKNFIEEAIHHD